jgi:CrcB protein
VWKSLAAICVGVILGRLLDSGVATFLSQRLPSFQPHPLALNLLGAILVAVIASLAALRSFPLEWPLFLLTGFCGGLTIVSRDSPTFVELLEQRRWLIAVSDIAIHVFGSVCMTLVGYRQVPASARSTPPAAKKESKQRTGDQG